MINLVIAVLLISSYHADKLVWANTQSASEEQFEFLFDEIALY